MKLTFVVFFIGTIASAMEDGIGIIFNDGIEDFSVISFPKDIQDNQRHNEVQSGFAVLPLLALLCVASTGETHLELHDSLGFTTQKFVLKQEYLKFITYNITLTIVNKVYVTNKVSLKKEFTESLTPKFGSEIQSIDFLNVADASAEINDWFDNETDHNITNILSSDDLNPNTSIVALSALYFHGKWAQAFDKKKTAEVDFYVSNDKAIKVVAMHGVGIYKYLESKDLNTKILELPMAESNTAMYIFVPNAIDEFQAVEEKVAKKTIISAEILKMTSHRVKICLPKFIIETKTYLRQSLENQNIKQMFNATSANLSHMLENEDDQVYVNHIIQKAAIKVCERGVNNAPADYNADNDIEVEFRAEQPFIYVVKMDGDYILGGIYTGQD